MNRQSGKTVILLVIFAIANILLSVSSVSAQSMMVLGELKTFGTVFIQTSNGQWESAAPVYPLLPDTAIKIEDGSASVYFSDGSRLDLSKDTLAFIKGTQADYSVGLVKGIIAFSITPLASLTVSTPTTVININKDSIVRKIGLREAARTNGSVSVDAAGTAVRNYSGRMLVNVSSSDKRLIVAGESMFVRPDGTYKIYKTQAIIPIGGTIAGMAGGSVAAGAIAGTFVAATTVVSFKAWRHGHRVGSPHGF